LWVLGVLMFLVSYSALFWAEKTLPSGIASILVATIPTWTALLEIFVFKRREIRGVVLAGIGVGLGGVMILAFDPSAGVTFLPALAILVGVIGWSLGTVATTMMALPKSKVLSSGTQMLTGGVMLLGGSALIGEMSPLPHVSLKAGAAILYLIVAGSLIGFTAYQWLLNRMPASSVTSYAYVNPVVALMIGYWMGGESIGARILIGSMLVLASTMALLTSSRSPRPVKAPASRNLRQAEVV
jgi:drug/metabolite transporter (DMT)-like permease